MKLLAAIAAATTLAAAPVNVTITAAHTAKGGAKWPVTIRATDAKGKPLRATLTMRILLGTIAVGKVDNGKVWHFVGTWHEPKGQEITWPASAKGQTFSFEAKVHANGRTVTKLFAVHVR